MESVISHPFYKAAMSSKLLQEGAHGAAWGFGLGKDGLFNRSTFTASKFGNLGRIGRVGMRTLGPVGTVFGAVSGYKEGGITGAAKNLAIGAAVNFAWGMGAQAISAVGGSAMTVGVPLAVLSGVGYGTYKALQFGNARVRKQRNMELGSPIIDPFGTASTMRQRSLQALQNSQFNGRSAFSSEAALMHMPMMR